jgi:hypothetical protein
MVALKSLDNPQTLAGGIKRAEGRALSPSSRPSAGELTNQTLSGEISPHATTRSGGADGAGLFNSHNSSLPPWNPFDKGTIEIWEGAGLIKVTKARMNKITAEDENNDKPKRGIVKEFSRTSRMRMMKFLAKIRLADDFLPLFGTTTYPDIFPTEAEKFKRDIRVLIDRMKRRFPKIGLLWRLEFQIRKSGINVGKVAPHFHWLLWNVPKKFDFKPEHGEWVKLIQISDDTWQIKVRFKHDGRDENRIESANGQDRFTEWLSRNWYDITGTGDVRHYDAGTNVIVPTSKKQVYAYVSKYIGKIEEGNPCPCPGRYWGVVQSKNIPMGNRVVIQCSGNEAAKIMRIQRHFILANTNRKIRFNSWSLSCFCDADFWAKRIPQILNL